MNKAEYQQLRDRIARIGYKAIDTCEMIVDTVSAGLDKSAHTRRAPAHVARRQIANMLRVSQFCAYRACRRSHCCRGEPAHCLQSVLPLLPAQRFSGLRRGKRRTAKM
ncbi:MAG: hypothetical protein NTU64_10520 [Hyphomicrobiales bacterium]|nr:hypothetical protein [Hyphomicrobiales bacterium]